MQIIVHSKDANMQVFRLHNLDKSCEYFVNGEWYPVFYNVSGIICNLEYHHKDEVHFIFRVMSSVSNIDVIFYKIPIECFETNFSRHEQIAKMIERM